MKNNTVVLSLEDYNNLRDFKEKLLKGKVCVWRAGQCLNYAFYEEHESELNKIIEENKRLYDRVKGLEKQVASKMDGFVIKEQNDRWWSEKFSNMNWIQFNKWKKRNK